MILNKKMCGRVKVTEDENIPPTILTEIPSFTAAVDAHEILEVLAMVVLNIFVHTTMPVKDDRERVIIKIRGKLVD